MSKVMTHATNEGDGTILYENGGTAQSSGDVVVVGSIIAVLKGDVAANASIPAHVRGVVNSTKKSGAAWTQGAKIYWDADPGEFTVTSGDGVFAGVAYEAAASTAVLGKVLLNQGIQA